MSVITFVNNMEEETGKSLSATAIATNMAIGYNNKILLVSTTNKEDRINSCFFEDTQVKKLRKGIFGENRNTLDTQTGIEGISKIARSNKLTPEMITNYTKVVFKDRLEFLPGRKRTEKDDEENNPDIDVEYVDLINAANMYYDKVIVDLDKNLSEETRDRIINLSDLIVVNINQNYRSLVDLKEDMLSKQLLQSPKTLLLIGRFDKHSKYNVKNITRFLEEKNKVLTVPYNTLFFEASNEASVPDLFLKFRRLSDSEDRNAIFINEVKRATENIIYRLQELEARY